MRNSLLLTSLLACCSTADPTSSTASPDPIFRNSVESNSIDFIKQSDPSTFDCLAFEGQSRQEMPSKLRNGLFLDDVYVYRANFTDGTNVPLWLDPGITNVESLARDVAFRVGQLPTLLRQPLDHVVINTGDAAASEEADGGFFMLYEDNIRFRMKNHDLSETVFHESVHVSLQSDWLGSKAWRDAVAADPGFITDYATTDDAEDFAESALFAYAYLKHPERLPATVISAIEETIPNRVNVFQNIIVDWAPHVYQVGERRTCP